MARAAAVLGAAAACYLAADSSPLEGGAGSLRELAEQLVKLFGSAVEWNGRFKASGIHER